jgi:hypothetical protein
MKVETGKSARGTESFSTSNSTSSILLKTDPERKSFISG